MKTNQVRCVTKINFATRGELSRQFGFSFDFVKEFSSSDTWVDLTNKAKIVVPKNIYVIDEQGNKLPLGGTTPNKLIDNLFRRGDAVDITFGYYMYENGNELLETSKVFEGFVTKVHSKIPIELECEDNMWLLKQIACKPQVWPKSKSLESLFKSLLSGTDFTVNMLTQTSVGNLIIGNETVAQLLERLRKDFHFESYFRGSELRIGSVVYIEAEAKEHQFHFQKNIIEDSLEFQRKDDVKLSAVVNSIVTKDGKTNKKGKTKTKQEHVSVLVYSEDGSFKHIVKKKNVDFPPNVEGERRTLFFPNTDDTDELATLGINELKKYYYSGFKGKFKTFAVPFVQMGDNVRLKDAKMPDRDGLYKVRGVEYDGGVGGHRQTIELDYKLNG